MPTQDYFIFTYHFCDMTGEPTRIIVHRDRLDYWFKLAHDTLNDRMFVNSHFSLRNANGKRLWWIDRSYKNANFHENLSTKFDLAERINECRTPEGEMWYTVWSRDCDMCEGTSGPYLTEANPYHWKRTVEADYEWAEGPMHHSLLTPDEADEARGRPDDHRDLALEAFEDGHPHVVSQVRFDEEGTY